jgi:TadE-like protein
MKLKQIRDDTLGAAFLETALTLPAFLLLTFGLLQAGLMLWTQVGLQHGVDMAARCASVNDAAFYAGFTTSRCFPGTLPNAVTSDMIKSYAAKNSFGVNPPASAFTVNQGVSCGIGTGNQVIASFKFDLMHTYIFSPTLRAQSCYPTTTS